ncbi:hypothetical protein GWK47_041341 [Chionoecetes opilio]|uniref:Uncharacterized protein n=1 Tax=Chionoecetes opilio TaxID=41210 RepID=A0A8J5CX88_CHIOP|nr:hypothetical protein GWK47_041341 [Chionoecetes opilio]
MEDTSGKIPRHHTKLNFLSHQLSGADQLWQPGQVPAGIHLFTVRGADQRSGPSQHRKSREQVTEACAAGQDGVHPGLGQHRRPCPVPSVEEARMDTSRPTVEAFDLRSPRSEVVLVELSGLEWLRLRWRVFWLRRRERWCCVLLLWWRVVVW